MPLKNHTGSRTVSDEVCLYPRSITVFVKFIVWQKIRVTKESTLEIRFPFSCRHPIFLPLYILDNGGNSWGVSFGIWNCLWFINKRTVYLVVLLRILFLNICFEGIGSESKHSSKVSVKHLCFCWYFLGISLGQFNSCRFWQSTNVLVSMLFGLIVNTILWDCSLHCLEHN